jgi:hypothetical protein
VMERRGLISRKTTGIGHILEEGSLLIRKANPPRRLVVLELLPVAWALEDLLAAVPWWIESRSVNVFDRCFLSHLCSFLDLSHSVGALWVLLSHKLTVYIGKLST